LPHFKTPGFGAELGLASSIAELLCLDHLRQLRTGALRVTPKFTGRDATMPQ